MKRYTASFAATLSLLALSGCSALWSSAPKTPAPPVQSIELYLSRGSSQGSDFEQFKLSGDSLYKECGPIKRGRQYAAEQEVVPLPSEYRPLIDEAAAAVISALSVPNTVLAKPGASSGIFDPGEISLALKTEQTKVKVATSLDTVSDPDGPTEEKILKLVKLVRTAAGLPFCGTTQFYGIKPAR
jgi:hypothetical protein